MSYHCHFPLTHTKKISTLNHIEVYGYMVTKRTGLGPTNNKESRRRTQRLEEETSLLYKHLRSNKPSQFNLVYSNHKVQYRNYNTSTY